MSQRCLIDINGRSQDCYLVSKAYGDMTVKKKKIEYLGMDMDYTQPGEVKMFIIISIYIYNAK